MTSPATPQSLREYVRGHASEFLVDPNITSVGVGHKVVDGRRIDEVCVQFTVRQKVDLADLEPIEIPAVDRLRVERFNASEPPRSQR